MIIKITIYYLIGIIFKIHHGFILLSRKQENKVGLVKFYKVQFAWLQLKMFIKGR